MIINIIFEIISWAAMIVLTISGVPQLILNIKKKSVQGLSWLMFGSLFFGMSVLSIRSFFETGDIVIRINYSLGALIALLINIQIFYYRIWKKN